MTKILITGATGFTGRYLAPLLAGRGHEVHGTVFRDNGPSSDSITRLHEIDLGEAGAVAKLVDDIQPDKVVHLAAISFVAHSDVEQMYRTNLLGTRHLLDALARGRKRPDSVLIASSANIYGNAREGMREESDPPEPANDYGVTKAASEMIAATYAERLPLIVTRPFNYTGRGQAENFLIPKIVSHVRSKADRIELGNLDVARDFSDVRGVVDAYVRLLDCHEAIGGTFNICSGRATSLGDVLEMAQRISGHRLDVRVNPDFVRENEVRSLWGSPARIEQAIGPLAMPPLEDTLRWMIED